MVTYHITEIHSFTLYSIEFHSYHDRRLLNGALSLQMTSAVVNYNNTHCFKLYFSSAENFVIYDAIVENSEQLTSSLSNSHRTVDLQKKKKV